MNTFKHNFLNDDLSKQSEIVRQRLKYHFAKVGGGWNIESMKAPFMEEFLNEVAKLVELSKNKEEEY
jgi:hypothetical protein